MTAREARTELGKIRHWRQRILDRQQRLSALRESLYCARTQNYSMIAKGATALDRVESIIDRASALEAEILDNIISMSEEQQRITQNIETLPEPYCTVLSKRHIHLQRFEQIAVDMHYSYDHVKHLESAGVEIYAKVNTK